MSDDDVTRGQQGLSASLESLKSALRDGEDMHDETFERDDTDRVVSRYAQSRNEEAVKMARKNLQQDPNNPQLRDWLAFNLYAIDQVDEAIAIYESLLAVEENAEQIYYLANCYYKRGEHRKAIIAWKRSIELAPNSHRAKKAQKRIEKVKARMATPRPDPAPSTPGA